MGRRVCWRISYAPEDFAKKAVAVLKDPAAYRPLGRAAEQLIAEQYSLERAAADAGVV